MALKAEALNWLLVISYSTYNSRTKISHFAYIIVSYRSSGDAGVEGLTQHGGHETEFIVTTTDLLAGVLLLAATLSTGTSTFASGK